VRDLRYGLPSLTCPYPGVRYQDTHDDKIVRLRARLVRGYFFYGVTMAIGTVKWFNTAKGFGFIQPEDGGKDVFVHISAVERAGLGTLQEGQRVEFDVVNERGKNAAGNLKAA
jgi:CspA family cold shock protein